MVLLFINFGCSILEAFEVHDYRVYVLNDARVEGPRSTCVKPIVGVHLSTVFVWNFLKMWCTSNVFEGWVEVNFKCGTFQELSWFSELLLVYIYKKLQTCFEQDYAFVHSEKCLIVLYCISGSAKSRICGENIKGPDKHRVKVQTNNHFFLSVLIFLF